MDVRLGACRQAASMRELPLRQAARADVFDEATKESFRKRARADGNTIEAVIQRTYTRLSEGWAGALVIDGGAHAGRHTFPMAALPNVARVIAVEANDTTFARLDSSVAANPSGAKVSLVFAALQDDPDRREIDFVKSSTHSGRSGINPVLRNALKTEFDAPAPVPATTIDKLAATSPARCAFIKLDLEGGEYFALRGGARCLGEHRPVVFFENGKDAPRQNGYTVQDFAAYFDSLGYDFLTVFCEPMTPAAAADFWYAWATPKETRETNVALMQALVAAG